MINTKIKKPGRLLSALSILFLCSFVLALSQKPVFAGACVSPPTAKQMSVQSTGV
jgi:hypothetical protein